MNRISPISMPRGILALPGGLPPTDGSHLGFNDGIGFPPPRGRGQRPWQMQRRKTSAVVVLPGTTTGSRLTSELNFVRFDS